MGFIPYSCQTIEPEDIEAVVAVMRSEFLTQGPAVERFEAVFAERHSLPHAIAVSNATAGLHIACLALGVGPGDVVWTAPNSFVASANCALMCGASVDFVDIDPVTRNMSVTELQRKLEAAQRAGKLPRVVVPVDFSGLPCDLREMRELADRYGFRIVADCSHATGASYQGRPVGSPLADISVFSFHAVKIISTAEGGMVTTHDAALARSLRALRSHGLTRDPAEFQQPSHGPWYYEQHSLGYNYRLNDLQSALGNAQLQRLPQLHARRRQLAAQYDRLLAGLPLLLPARLPDRESSWHLYVVEVDAQRTRVTRAAVFAALRAANIGANVHYIPIHLQPFYRARGFRDGDFPAAERYYQRAVTVPLFPRMSDAQQQTVVAVLTEALRGA